MKYRNLYFQSLIIKKLILELRVIMEPDTILKNGA